MKRVARLMLLATIVVTTESLLYAPGYITRAFLPGDNLFENPLLLATNSLSSIFKYARMPDGTTVSLWNPVSSSFDITSTNVSGSWTVELELLLGTGAKLHTSTAFTNVFLGTALNHDGTVYSPDGLPLPAPVFPGPVGVHLLGDRCPFGASGTEAFTNVIGRMPVIGEKVTTLDEASQIYTTCTYLGGGSWDIEPTLNVSDAAFFNILVAPIPLNYTVNGTNLILSWTQPGFSLATGTNVNAITNIISTASPYTNSVAEPQRYFRLIYQ